MNPKVLLCATNAGGVKNLIPIARELSRRKVRHRFLVGSSVGHLAVIVPRGNRQVVRDAASEGFLRRILVSVEPTILIVGTTSYASPDRRLTRLAREAGVRTLAVLDEWYNYRIRFEGDGGKLDFLPDLIAAMDRRAAFEAAQDGIPREIVRVTGNPALSEMARNRSAFRRRPPERPDFLPGDRKVVTFLSEEFKADYSDEQGRSVLGPYQGYDEDTVLRDLLESVRDLDEAIFVVEKLHPASRKAAQRPAQVGRRILHARVRGGDTIGLLWHSHAVVGMKSVALLEAAILGKRAASFQPGLRFANQCSAVKKKAVPLLRDRAELTAWLKKALQRPGGASTRRRWSFTDPRACENILRLGGILH